MNTHRGPLPRAGKDRFDRRQSSRTMMSLPVVLITSFADEHPAIIQNVSTLGFKLRSEHKVTVGRFLSLNIPGLAAYSGWVAWSHLDQFGLDVANAIPEPVIKHIVTMASQASASLHPELERRKLDT